MGATVASATVASKTVENDDDIKLDGVGLFAGGVPSVALASMGTAPALTSLRGGSGHARMRVTSGTGTPAIAANNIQVTCSRAPRKVFLAVTGTQTPGFYVDNITGSVINIGTKVAPAVSTAYDFEIIVLF